VSITFNFPKVSAPHFSVERGSKYTLCCFLSKNGAIIVAFPHLYYTVSCRGKFMERLLLTRNLQSINVRPSSLRPVYLYYIYKVSEGTRGRTNGRNFHFRGMMEKARPQRRLATRRKFPVAVRVLKADAVQAPAVLYRELTWKTIPFSAFSKPA
jgi:hypothetical protein